MDFFFQILKLNEYKTHFCKWFLKIKEFLCWCMYDQLEKWCLLMCKMFWQADLDGERLITDIKHDVIRSIAFDAVMKVRTSTGVTATDFYGHFFMSNTTDMELASIDCDKVRKCLKLITMNVQFNIKGICTFVQSLWVGYQAVSFHMLPSSS